MEQKRLSFGELLLTYPQCKKTKEELLEWLQQNEKITCAVVCQEDHHATEGKHLHAWIKFNARQRVSPTNWNTYMDWNGIHGNWQIIKKSANNTANAVKYVMKDGNYTAWNCDPTELSKGAGSHKKKINTLHVLETDIKELVKNNEISPRDYNSIVRAQAHWKLITSKVEDSEHTKGIWIVGPPRIGKSKSVRVYGERHGGLYLKAQNKWWDGYQMEPNVLIDDFDTDMLWHHLKLWADCYSFPAEVKGATVTVNFKHLFITSNYTIDQLVAKKSEQVDFTLLEALKERFVVIDWNNYCEQYDWLTCELIEHVLGEDTTIKQPNSKRNPPTEKSTPKEHEVESDFANNGLM